MEGTFEEVGGAEERAEEGEVFGDEGGEEHDGGAIVEAAAAQEGLAPRHDVPVVFEDDLEGRGRASGRVGGFGLHDLQGLGEGGDAIAAAGPEAGRGHSHGRL